MHLVCVSACVCLIFCTSTRAAAHTCIQQVGALKGTLCEPLCACARSSGDPRGLQRPHADPAKSVRMQTSGQRSWWQGSALTGAALAKVSERQRLAGQALPPFMH